MLRMNISFKSNIQHLCAGFYVLKILYIKHPRHAYRLYETFNNIHCPNPLYIGWFYNTLIKSFIRNMNIILVVVNKLLTLSLYVR